jgi:hypothetical protein
MSFYTWENNLY